MNSLRAAATACRLLLVDDDDGFATALAMLLEADGRFEILASARDGREAVRLAHTLRPDVVVMDIEMPVMDGIEATARILADQPSTQVISVSGSDHSERTLEARFAGAYDIIHKSQLHSDLVPAILAAHAEQTTAPRLARPAP